MKHGILAAMLVVLMGSSAVAQHKILVLAFEAVGPEQGQKGWVARALQQNLMAELSRVPSIKPASGTTSAADQDAALRAADAAGARYVVFGSYQAVNSDLRITGQVVDASKRQSITGLKATGSQRDLFGLEDTIAAQVKRALPQSQPATPEAAAPAGAAAEMLEQPRPASQPERIVPRGPVEMGRTAQAADALADEMERAIERIRYRNTWYEDEGYDRPYRYRRHYGYGYPYSYGYPVYYYPGHVHVPSGGGIIGMSPGAQRYPGKTEFGRPRLSFPNFTPDGNFHKRK